MKWWTYNFHKVQPKPIQTPYNFIVGPIVLNQFIHVKSEVAPFRVSEPGNRSNTATIYDQHLFDSGIKDTDHRWTFIQERIFSGSQIALPISNSMKSLFEEHYLSTSMQGHKEALNWLLWWIKYFGGPGQNLYLQYYPKGIYNATIPHLYADR